MGKPSLTTRSSVSIAAIRYVTVWLASFLGAAFCSPAMAVRSHWHDTKITVSNFVMTLVDILPDDGIAPWANLNLQGGYTSVLGDLYQPGFTSASNTEPWLYGENSASVENDLVLGTLEMRARAFSKDDPFSEGGVKATAWASTGEERGAQSGLVVGPGTKVVVSATATFELAVLNDMGRGYAQLGFVCGKGGPAWGQLRVECGKVDNPLNRNAVAGGLLSPGSHTATIESGFANWSKHPVETGFFAESSVVVTSLPEPSTYALLSLGGAMLFGMRRRFERTRG